MDNTNAKPLEEGYNNISVKQVVESIDSNSYVLPSIQREFIWNPEQVENLFDSILSGYPFGSMLAWNYVIPKRKERDYKFYKFLDKYDQSDEEKNHNPELGSNLRREVIAILDGQQRLTSLFIGLNGHMKLRKNKRRKKNEQAEDFEKKNLYINLFYSKEQNGNDEDSDISPQFKLRFLSSDEASEKNIQKSQEEYWFEVGKVLLWENLGDAIAELLQEANWAKGEQKKRAEEICKSLYDNIVKQEKISIYLVKTSSLDKVLNIFVRINNGGTRLGFADFLMSMIVTQWKDGRDRINDAVDGIINDFNFKLSSDVFITSFLYFNGENLRIKIGDFKPSRIRSIEKDYEDVKKHLRNSCEIFKALGYSEGNLRSKLIFLPLAFWLRKNSVQDAGRVSQDNLSKIKEWIQRSILTGVWGGQTRSYLTELRKIINESSVNDFPLSEIIAMKEMTSKNLKIEPDDLDGMIKGAKKGSQDSWALLTMLYSDHDLSKTYEEDHIFPHSKLGSKKNKEHGGDYLPNLQLLTSEDNKEKSDKEPTKWLPEYCASKNTSEAQYRKDNFIPEDIDLSFDNFSTFIDKRKSLMKTALWDKLKI